MIARFTLLTGAACAALAAPSEAHAQQPAEMANPAPPEAPQEPRVGADDIIVTARKRQESILRVPVVANVVTQARLEQQQIVSLEAITRQSPGFVLGNSVLENGVQVSIRGVGTTSLDPGIDQSVSLNIDGMQFSQGNAYGVGLFDMAQVEVLKGPQALFFGKNSPGGVVSIRTADPGRDFEAIGRLSYEAEAQTARGEGVVSGPVSDTLGARFAGAYVKSRGTYFENETTVIPALGAIQPPRNIGGYESFLVRGTLLYRPTGGFSARLKLNYSNEDYDKGGAIFQLTSCPDGTGAYLPSLGLPLPSFFGPREACKVDRKLNLAYFDPAAFGGGISNGGVPFTRTRQFFTVLEMNYDIAPSVTATSVTGFYDLRTESLLSGSYFGAYAPFAAQKLYKRKEVTQELRLATDFSGPFNLLAGGFYQNGDVFDEATLPANTRLGLPGTLIAGTFDMDIESKSVFGQARYKPARTLEVSAGVRYTDEKRSIDMTTQAGGFSFVPTVPNLRFKNWSPELTVTFTPTDDLTLFGSLKQGYKSGSYNIVQPIFPGTDNSYGDEKVQGGEAGIKTRLADRQINVNLAGYFYKFKGLQVGINQPAAFGLPVLSTVNAGSAEVYGVDFDFGYRPRALPGLNVYAAVNWNKAKFTSFVGAPCAGGQTFAEGCNLLPRILNPTEPSDAIALATGNFFTDTAGNRFQYSSQDLTGTPLSRAPEWQVTGGVDYELALGGRSKLRLGVNAQYSSKYLANLGRRADFYQGAFAKLNANVAYVGPDNRWELALIGNNLADKLTTGTCFNSNYAGGILFPGNAKGGPRRGPAGSDEIFCSYAQGREVWLRLTIRG